MRTIGIKDIFLPPRIAYHVKIILVSLLLAVFFVLVRDGRPWAEGSIHLFLLMFIQLELFLWLGRVFFTFKDQYSPREIVRKSVVRLLIFYLSAFFISALIYVLYMTVLYLIMGWDLNNLITDIMANDIKGFIIGAGSGYAIGAIIFFYLQWVDALKREQALREEKLIFQFETLKSQVNPHFLFNSLNTLSSLVHKDPDLSDEFIRRLSGIYRYILENMDQELVDLEKELSFARDYFYLQQIRDNGKIELDIEIPKPAHYRILPISLQMLMENALKHNAATREKPLVMGISLDPDGSVIRFRNNLQPKQQLEKSSGIGLRNLNERAKLILNQEIAFSESGSEFIVEIPVKHREHENTDR